MKRLFSAFAFLALTTVLGLSGCSNQYSDSIQYGVRNDPLVRDKNLTKVDKWWDPDPPGLLPLLSIKDLQDPRNPLFNASDPSGRKLFDEDKLIDPTAIPADQRKMLEDALFAIFGTPAQPKVQVDENVVADLGIDMPTLREGSRLYRLHCVHCHGVPGDGRGPTARWINPHPRDFRQGIFKFQTVVQPRPPRRADLYRVLEQGLDGSAMPAFVLLKKAEIDAMVSYVIHLSVRGKAEFDIIKDSFQRTKDGELVFGSKTSSAEELQNAIFRKVQASADSTARAWLASKNERPLDIAENPYTDEKARLRSLLRGKLLFLGKGGEEKVVHKNPDGTEETLVEKIDSKRAKEANCAECHVDYGRRAQFVWDDWGTQVRPRNFTDGLFRGGKRSVDIYHRIHGGINGSGMQSYAGLGSETIWDLVNFVQALGYPKMREKLGID